MNRTTRLLGLFAASLLATVALVLVAGRLSPAPDAPAERPVDVGEPDGSGHGERDDHARRTPRAATVRTPEEEQELQQRLVLALRQLYGDRISSTSAQILMAQFRIQVMTLFPGDGPGRFREILEQAFPGRAGEILATLAKVDDFDDWLADNEDELAALSPEEREKAVLDKKREMFGEQAAAELEAETHAAERREARMGEALASLAGSSDTTLDQKLDVYVDAVRGNAGDGLGAVALENGGVMAQAFFGLESVSKQLAELDPEARQEKINDIRRELGYDEEQIAALEERDQQREARWQNGLAYMDERRALEQRYSGDQLDQQLAALRERYFGFEAKTIGLEEGDGFFRFERPRLYGRN